VRKKINLKTKKYFYVWNGYLLFDQLDVN